MAESIIYNSKQKQLAHELVEAIFSGADLENFCKEYFPSVFYLFTPAMSDSRKIKILIEECADRRGELKRLALTVKSLKPKEYKRFERDVDNGNASGRPASDASDFHSQGNGSYKAEMLLNKKLVADRYRVDKILDDSGQGTVFKAYDTRLKLDVAMKVIDLNQTNIPTLQERVRQEVCTAIRLDHPGVVQVYDCGEMGPLHYIVMEFIPGYNLRDIRQYFERLDSKVALPQMLQLVRQLCLTVDYLHQQRVLHPGIKPENIMLKNGQTTDGTTWQPILTNLGSLRPPKEVLLSDETPSTRRLTYSISPELLMGHITDARSDVYALGIILYNLIVGSPPFRPKDLSEASQLHVNAPPIPPRSTKPSLPVAVEQVILKALAKDPAERYWSAKDMAQALAGCLEESSPIPLAAAARQQANLAVLTEARILSVAPGEYIATKITLRNRGMQDNHCQVNVEGIPIEWVSISPAVATLLPDEDQAVTITIQPPRTPSIQAGNYPLTIQVTGQYDAQQVNQIQKTLIVEPYTQLASSLWPQQIVADQITQISVDNKGNAPETVTIRPKQDKNLAFNPPQKQFELKVGESRAVDFVVTPRSSWFEEAATHTFSFLVSSEKNYSTTHTGTVTSRGAPIPIWVLSAMALTLILFMCGVFVVRQSVVLPAQVVAATTAKETAAIAQIRATATATAKAQIAQTANAKRSAVQAGTATATWLDDDSDGDGLTNRQELEHHTTPDYWDSDGDTLPDGAEALEFKTNPLLLDSDFDGIPDDEEVRKMLDPLSRDTDLDGTPEAYDQNPGVASDSRTPTPMSTPPSPITISFKQPPDLIAIQHAGPHPRYQVNEDHESATIEVELNQLAPHQIQVDFATGDSNATMNKDYLPTGGTLTFNTGEQRATFKVQILDDDENEDDEIILLTLRNASPGVQINTYYSELVITDDDWPTWSLKWFTE